MLPSSQNAIMNYTKEGWNEYVQGKTSLNLGNMNLIDENIVELAEVLKKKRDNPFYRSQ